MAIKYPDIRIAVLHGSEIFRRAEIMLGDSSSIV
jgi:hypothetical protein